MKAARCLQGVRARACCRSVRAHPLGAARFSSQPPEEEEIDMKAVALNSNKIKDNSTKRLEVAFQAADTSMEVAQPENLEDLASLQPFPEEHAEREVVIKQNHPNPGTWDTQRTKGWFICWNRGQKWSNPLMGWTSSGDPLSNLRIQFDTIEEAQHYCDKMGWKARVQAPSRGDKTGLHGETTYAHNFLPKKVEQELASLGRKTKRFDHAGENDSHYFRPLTFHGNGEVNQHGPKG
ncbi:unnamed protein product [Chrysoparadoxa australica]